MKLGTWNVIAMWCLGSGFLLIPSPSRCSAQEFPDYTVVPIREGGTLTGRVRFMGDIVPEPERFQVSDAEICGKEKFAPAPIIHPENRGVLDALISLSSPAGIRRGKPWEFPQGKPTLVQRACVFAPHILVVPLEAEIEVINDDPILHSVQSIPVLNLPFNLAQPATLPRMLISGDHTFEAERIPIRCAVHRWMGAWIVVSNHPYHGVTDAGGAFTIANIPAGRYRATCWHESFGELETEIEVGSGQKIDAEFAYPGTVSK